MPDERGGTEPPPGEPTALRFVGPATAAAIEAAGFDAEAIRSRLVSYRDLVRAGVNPGVAAKLRREYSLVWTFEWEPGADLGRRAAYVSGLDADQRDWVAASESRAADATGTAGDGLTAEERRWRDRDDWVAAALRRSGDPTCPRCDGDLALFEFGDRRSVQCEACGYVGLTARVGPDSNGDGEAWAEALDRFDRAEPE